MEKLHEYVSRKVPSHIYFTVSYITTQVFELIHGLNPANATGIYGRPKDSQMAADVLAPSITALINKNIGILFPVSRRPNRIAQFLVMVNFERHLTYLRKMKLELSTHHLKA